MLISEFLVLRLNSFATTNNLVFSGKDNIHKQLSILMSYVWIHFQVVMILSEYSAYVWILISRIPSKILCNIGLFMLLSEFLVLRLNYFATTKTEQLIMLMY